CLGSPLKPRAMKVAPTAKIKLIVLTPNFSQKYPLHRIYRHPSPLYTTTQRKGNNLPTPKYVARCDFYIPAFNVRSGSPGHITGLVSAPRCQIDSIGGEDHFPIERNSREGKGMRKSKTTLVAIGVFVSLLYFSAFVPETLAQSAFTGVVKDQSGAVLPGVSVEASSPALIERSRSTVTNESGAYTILDLRPGAYTLSFSLPGFRTVKRDVELTANFVATINAEMTVGAVEETVTVQAESPVV